jgi:hypothetical protein
LLPIGNNVTDELKTRVLDLVDTISQTVDAVSSLDAINLSTTLEALSNNLGLSGVGAYTITNVECQFNNKHACSNRRRYI